MAIRTGDGVVQFGDNLTLGGAINGRVDIQALGVPTITSVQTGCLGQYQCVGGGSKTYAYKVVAVLADGLTSQSSAEVSTAVGFDDLSQDNQNNLVTWTPVEGAVGGYRIYRTVAGGTVTNTTGLIATVDQDVYPLLNNSSLLPTTPSYADVGAAGDSATPPTTNTTGYLQVNASSAAPTDFTYIEAKKGATSKFRLYDNPSGGGTPTLASGGVDQIIFGGSGITIPGANTIISGRTLCSGPLAFYLGESERTIASGVISQTQSFHTVDTEADAASDDLDTITPSLGVCELLILRAANSARTVTLKDGTGNLKLAGDMVLDNEEDTITLVYSVALSAWLEIARSNNGT
jgi:hypothetical protein